MVINEDQLKLAARRAKLRTRQRHHAPTTSAHAENAAELSDHPTRLRSRSWSDTSAARALPCDPGRKPIWQAAFDSPIIVLECSIPVESKHCG